MIIDPQSFMAVEMDRHLAGARAAQSARAATALAPRRHRLGRHRGLRLRLAAWATGRTIHA